jgi:peptidoglycan/xylan/chitin deacetylase (PgdA/CDA1 family)
VSRRTEARLLGLLPLAWMERAVPRGVVSLFYHVVSDERLPHVAPLYRYRTPTQFEDDLRWLAARYRFVGSAEAERASASVGGRPAVHLSFDDGFAECGSVARPILLRMGIPCTFFLVEGALDNRLLPAPQLAALCMEAARGIGDRRAAAVLAEIGEPRAGRRGAEERLRRVLRGLSADRAGRLARAAALLEVDGEAYLRERRPFLTSDEARAMAADGFELGAHTRAHVRLGGLPPEEVEREVADSCRAVAALAGAASVPFAFPYSGDGVDPALPAAIRSKHRHVGAFFDTGWLRRGAPGVLHRVPADPPPVLGGPGAAEHLRRGYWKALRGRT